MVEVVNLILAVVVCCHLQLVMGYEGGCHDYWWMGERERQQRETNLGILIKMSNDKENFLDLWLIVSMN